MHKCLERKYVKIIHDKINLDYEIVEIWHTIFLDFMHSLDIIKKVISKKFFILYFVSNLLIFSISHSGKYFLHTILLNF